MVTQAPTKRSLSPTAKLQFLERVKTFVNYGTWTPAEGALLVNGILPPRGGCLDIPDAAAQLEDLALPATQAQRSGASMVLRQYRSDVEAGNMPSNDRLTPDEFLVWCEDAVQMPRWRPKLPEFFRHLYYFGLYDEFTQTVDDEMATLRKAIAAETLNIPPAADSQAVERTTDVVLRKTIHSSKSRVNALDRLIDEAVTVADSNKTELVWPKLKILALDGEEPFTGATEMVARKKNGRSVMTEALVYQTDIVQADGSMMDSLTKDALDSRLRRRRPKTQDS